MSPEPVVTMGFTMSICESGTPAAVIASFTAWARFLASSSLWAASPVGSW